MLAVEGFIGSHPAFTRLIKNLQRISNKQVSVLLMGETGTGKGRCAQFIHQYSDRFDRSFIPYNCGAGPDTLFESQIFGHAKGAFTGADTDRPGLVEEAHNGILFLDEINSLSQVSQVKLNHFLETNHFRRIGENRMRKADVRVIAASNVDLREEIEDGNFREDLFFRLAEYELHLPPLRNRRDDVPLLADYFLKKFENLSGNGKLNLSPEATRQLLEYDWPGNVRELENLIKRSIIDAASDTITRITFPISNDGRTYEGNGSIESQDNLITLPWKEAKNRVVSSFERRYLESLLEHYDGVVARCAEHAGLQAPDFWKLMRKYDLSARIFRR